MDAKKIDKLLAGYLTVAQAAERLGIGVRAVQTLCNPGDDQPPILSGAIQIGRDWRIPPAAIDARLKSFGKGPIPQSKRPNPRRKSNGG